MEYLPLFVYGTLMKDFGNYNHYLKNKVADIVPGSTKGDMFDTGAFPAVIEGEGIIHGELMFINLDVYTETMARCDELEGYNPDADYSMYKRDKVTVTTPDEKVQAWIYRWTLPHLDECYNKISSGDWKDYLKAKLGKFSLGNVVITENAYKTLNIDDVHKAITRHHSGDWGNLTEEDKKANDSAVLCSDRILSSYNDKNGIPFWIVTEWNRSVTTVLLPEDY